MTDRALLDGIATGDRAALATLYERYSKPLHDFARRTVQDPEAAADVVQNVFIKIWNHLQDRPTPDHARAWIFSIARNEAIDEVRRSARAKPIGQADDDLFVQLDVVPAQSPEDALRDKEMASLVWSAAAALNVNAYSLLDMHLRQDLSLDEIGVALGTSPQNVYKNMSRMRESLEEAVADALLRDDDGECDELARIVSGFDSSGDLTSTGRRAISKHVRSCEICTESRRRVTAPAAIFGRLAPLPLAPHLADQMFGEVERSTGGSSSSAPGARSTSGLTKTLWMVAGGLAAAVLAFLLLTNASSPEPVDPSDAASTSHELGVESETSVVVITWTEIEADGFSVVWDAAPETLPDETIDWAGGTTRLSSPALSAGTWYFHLRTLRGERWTSTVHVGPFEIVGSPPATSATTTIVTPDESTTTTTTLPGAEPELAGEYSYRLDYVPSGDCGYAAFTDQVTVTLNEDGTASLSQAQHVSTGTWTFNSGVLMIDLVLNTEFPETYALTSTDGAATLNGQSTYEDQAGCITTYQVSTSN